jgi:hypothetical protein
VERLTVNTYLKASVLWRCKAMGRWLAFLQLSTRKGSRVYGVGLPLFCLVSTVYFVSQRLCPSCAKSVFVHYMTLAGTVVMHRLLFWGLCRVKEFTEVCSPMYRPPVIREQMVEACSSPE